MNNNNNNKSLQMHVNNKILLEGMHGRNTAINTCTWEPNNSRNYAVTVITKYTWNDGFNITKHQFNRLSEYV